MGEDKKRTMDGDGAAYGSIKKTKTTGAFTQLDKKSDEDTEESSKREGEEDISNGEGEEQISKGNDDTEESSKGDEEKIEEDMD
jgi:hypothetical protein